MARMLLPAALMALLACGCRPRPAPMTAEARSSCEGKASQTLGGFPGFPSPDPRNQSTPAPGPDDQGPAFHITGVVETDGIIRGVYDCAVSSPDSGRSWVVTDLKFNRVAPEAPSP
jgi:hypothetical protein